MNVKKLAVALAVVGLVASAAGPAMAAAPSVDSESTDTTTTSDVTDGSTQTYNESTNSTLAFSADSNATAIEVRQGADGRLLATYKQNSSGVLEYQTVASGTYYVNATFDDDASDYPGIEVGAGETQTVEYRILNNTESATADTTNVSVTFDNAGNTSFVHMNDSETKVAEDTGSGIRATIFGIGGNDSEAGAAEVEQEDVTVKGDDQDEVVVNVANSDAQDSMEAVYDTTEESDAFSTVAIADFGGETIPVFAAGQDKPDWFDDDMTYATVSEDGQTVTVVNAGETLSDSDEEADFSMTANDGIGFFSASSLASEYGAGFTEQYGLAASAFDLNGSPELEEV